MTRDFFRRQTALEFLDWLEETRGCGGSTKAQRLAAIRSFVRYGAVVDPRVVAIQADVEKIEFKKPAGKLVPYLTREELTLFLAQPTPATRTGFRDMAFLNLMYDSRPVVYLTGKGQKPRSVPLMPDTAEHMRRYLKKFHPPRPVKAEITSFILTMSRTECRKTM